MVQVVQYRLHKNRKLQDHEPKAPTQEGTLASVIVRLPAAAAAFPRSVGKHTMKDHRIIDLKNNSDKASPAERDILRAELQPDLQGSLR